MLSPSKHVTLILRQAQDEVLYSDPLMLSLSKHDKLRMRVIGKFLMLSPSKHEPVAGRSTRDAARIG